MRLAGCSAGTSSRRHLRRTPAWAVPTMRVVTLSGTRPLRVWCITGREVPGPILSLSPPLLCAADTSHGGGSCDGLHRAAARPGNRPAVFSVHHVLRDGAVSARWTVRSGTGRLYPAPASRPTV